MASLAYRLGALSHRTVNVAAAGTVVGAAAVVHGTKVVARGTGQAGRDFADGWVSTGGVSDTLSRWMNQPKARAEPRVVDGELCA